MDTVQSPDWGAELVQQNVTMYDIDMDTAGSQPSTMTKLRASNPQVQIICYISVGTWEPDSGRVVRHQHRLYMPMNNDLRVLFDKADRQQQQLHVI